MILADTKSCRDTSSLFKDSLVIKASWKYEPHLVKKYAGIEKVLYFCLQVLHYSDTNRFILLIVVILCEVMFFNLANACLHYSSSSSFSSGFSSADIELSLPAGVTVASLAWVGVCGVSNPSPVLASVVVLPQLVSNVPCSTTLIGELPSHSNNITGRVYIIDRITFAVLGFSYDGTAPGKLKCLTVSKLPL